VWVDYDVLHDRASTSVVVNRPIKPDSHNKCMSTDSDERLHRMGRIFHGENLI